MLKELVDFVKRHVHYGLKQLQYGLFLAPRGKGSPLSKELWDCRYREGYSERQLRSLNDFARYMIIAGYIQFLCKRPKILDIGCGDGILLEILPRSSFKTYEGIDLSGEAVKKGLNMAESKGLPATFDVRNFEEWTPAEKYDVIIFNESLYYAKHPSQIVLHYGQSLHESGLIIVSMCRFLHHPVMIWKNLTNLLDTIESTTIKTHKGEVYHIKVFKRRRGGEA